MTAPRTIDRPRRALHWASALILIVGLPVTAGLSYAARTTQRNTEHRLLSQRLNEAALILTANLPATTSTLSIAASVAEDSHADPVAMRRLLLPQIDGLPGRSLVTVSIWDRDHVEAPVLVVGTDPQASAPGAQPLRRFIRDAAAAKGLRIRNLLRAPHPGVGYAMTSPRREHRYVVYAESLLQPGRTQRVQTADAFFGADYALYLGPRVDPHNFIVSSVSKLPLRGRTGSTEVPFGNTTLLLVMAPHGELGGNLPGRLPWLIAIAGAAASFGFALMAERLLRNGDLARALAADNAALYQAQRSVAETLQQSLLPGTLPEFDDLVFGARYEPGVEGIEIGGDWYDVIEIDADRVLAVVGDVSGRGLSAGTVMASLRYAIRAHATQGDGPAAVLSKLQTMVSVVRDQHFATVLCIEIDRSARTLTIANAGHPKLLELADGDATFVETPVGPPIGVTADHTYEQVVRPIPEPVTLLVFTDGLFERRGESIETSMERLRTTVAGHGSHLALEALLSAVLADMTEGGVADDTALLGAAWQPTPS